jgi:glucose-1-phosphate thymidylyltransferase
VADEPALADRPRLSRTETSVDDVVAIVLARGLGRRMREDASESIAALNDEQARVASSGVKGLMPVSIGGRPGRPFLDYLLSAIADAGIRSVGLVIGPEHDVLRRHYTGDHAPTRLTLDIVIQQEALGTADAVRAAERFVDGRPFLSLNSDNLYPVGCLRALVDLGEAGLPGFERDDLIRSSGIPPERFASFALIDVDPAGYLVDILEKPGRAVVEAAGPRALVSMNAWRFDAGIFGACRDVPRSPRGEFELPEAVRLAMRRGSRFKVVPSAGPVLDLSRREDVATVAAYLSRYEPRL